MSTYTTNTSSAFAGLGAFALLSLGLAAMALPVYGFFFMDVEPSTPMMMVFWAFGAFCAASAVRRTTGGFMGLMNTLYGVAAFGLLVLGVIMALPWFAGFMMVLANHGATPLFWSLFLSLPVYALLPIGLFVAMK